jgi:hypothetical protein
MTEKKQGYKKHLEAKPVPEPKAGYKKYFEAEKEWDGTFADTSENPLSIRQDVLETYAKEGLAFKWVRSHVYGYHDVKNLAMHKRNLWTPVEKGDFPEIENVEQDGLILMARPKHIDDKARRLEEAESVAPVHIMKTRAGEGVDVSMPGGGSHSSARSYNKMNRTYERMEIPDDRERILKD